MRKLRLVATVAVLAVLILSASSCGSERGILFIQVIPSSALLTTQVPTVQFIANGVFERGPDENITDRVTWASTQPQIVTVSSGGLATAGTVCGSTIITASLDGVTDTSSVTVSLDVCP